MNSWKIYKIGDLTEPIKKSVNPTKLNSPLPYIGLEHIQEKAFLLNGVGNSTDVESNKYSFQINDILYGKLRPYFQKVYKPKFNGICSTDILVFRSVTDEIIGQDYLYQIIRNKFFTDWAMEGYTGTRMPRADWAVLKNKEILIPPKIEQEQICKILSSLDDKIELNLEMNITIEEMAMAIYKEWFVDFGPFKNGEFVESELGLIPKGWKITSLFETGKFINGAAFRSDDFTTKNIGIPIIKISELKNGITKQTNFANKNYDKKYLLGENEYDILFSWSGSPETSLNIFFWIDGLAWLNQHIFKVIPEPNLRYWLIYTLKYLKKFFINLAKNKQTTGLGHVTVSDLKTKIIFLPIKSVLDEYNAIISPIHNLFISNLKENRFLIETRDYLLPKLISGEIRVKDAENDVKNIV
ncbi:MAG: restriction endonuclease subunit S [Bacteroidota bacterium]